MSVRAGPSRVLGASAAAVARDPLLTLQSDDPGDATARNFRYQHAYGVILLVAALRGDRPYSAIWCEHHDDFLAERTDGAIDAVQVKTRRPERGDWTIESPEVVGALGRFVRIAEIFGERANRLYLVSNVDFPDVGDSVRDQSRRGRNPKNFLRHVKALADVEVMSTPFRSFFDGLVSKIGCDPTLLLTTLRKVDLVKGPSRDDFDASLAHEHLASLDSFSDLPAGKLDEARDALVALVARAASLRVADPSRHLHPLLQLDAVDPSVSAKRLSTEVVTREVVAGASARDVDALHSRFDDLFNELAQRGELAGLNRPQLRALLAAFSEEDVPANEALPLLLAKAEELTKLKAVLETQAANAPSRSGLRQVLEALDAGDYGQADRLLNGFIAEGAADRALVLNDAVDLYAARGQLADAQLHFGLAAQHFGIAAGVAMAFDPGLAFDLIGNQAQALIDYGRTRPGVDGLRLAIATCHRRRAMAPEGSRARTAAAGQLLSALGLHSERAGSEEAQQAIDEALEIGRKLLKDIDQQDDQALWLKIANSLGAVLNNAARAAPLDAFPLLIEESISVLSEAAKLARANGHVEQGNLETNLATALRLRANGSEDPRPALELAISHRLRAIEESQDAGDIEYGNMFDSLGNDYTALAVSEERCDLKALSLAMAAYRKALSFRGRSAAPINWARTQYNIGHACAQASLRVGAPAKLKGRALFRLKWALSEFSLKAAPQDWVNTSMFYAHLLISELQAGVTVPELVLMDLCERLCDLADHADQTVDVLEMMKIMELQGALTHAVYVERAPFAEALLVKEKGRLAARLAIHAQTPMAPFLAISDVQLESMLSDLADDAARAHSAHEAAKVCLELARSIGPEWLGPQVEEVIEDLRAVAEAVAARSEG